jgi:hypothetical protein
VKASEERQADVHSADEFVSSGKVQLGLGSRDLSSFAFDKLCACPAAQKLPMEKYTFISPPA